MGDFEFRHKHELEWLEFQEHVHEVKNLIGRAIALKRQSKSHHGLASLEQAQKRCETLLRRAKSREISRDQLVSWTVVFAIVLRILLKICFPSDCIQREFFPYDNIVHHSAA